MSILDPKASCVHDDTPEQHSFLTALIVGWSFCEWPPRVISGPQVVPLRNNEYTLSPSSQSPRSRPDRTASALALLASRKQRTPS